MRADEFPALLRELTIPGATVRSADGGPGSGLEHGFVVTGQRGGRMDWQVALQRDGAPKGLGSAVFPVAPTVDPHRLTPVDTETLIAAWIGQSPAAEHITDLVQYSTEGRKAGIRCGLQLTLDTGGRVFIQLLRTKRPDSSESEGEE